MVHKSAVFINANMRFVTEIPCVALLGLVGVRIPFLLTVLGGTGRRDDRRVYKLTKSSRYRFYKSE